jgi:hypothetical protein
MKKPSARKAAGHAAFWLFIAVCAVALYQRAAATPEPMQPDEFSRVTRQVASDAVEASRLSRALAIGQVTTHFARSHIEQLGQDLDDLRKQLDRPAPTGRAADVEHVRDAAQRLGSLLGSMPAQMADGDAMARVQQQQENIGRELGAGGGS